MPDKKIHLKDVSVLVIIFSLILILTSCPQAYSEIKNRALIYPQYNGEGIEGKTFSVYGHSESELITLRADKPCFEISWKMDGDELSCYVGEVTDSIGNGHCFALAYGESSLQVKETVLKITYFPAGGDPIVIDNIDSHWFDSVISGSRYKFSADFGSREFTEKV